MKTINKGNEIFIGENPVGYGLAERAGFFKKGLSTGCRQSTATCNVNTDNITGRISRIAL